ncbi:polyphosphate:AMP phosphotransferase [Arhodomonas aquaeolei]|uniref:polyphosphate:AMP phosphotransferase n=1 Tax=Arhodomonas aquaeolei TaxID=2369 RepID=UPI0021679FE7|nr:polyphosphate:AMP phosphotransferase [Arhodomonas aquaeolei]MCS4504035.1 polyphosphate:AMP phosphotransferase [Arhodomonas aquaeolei]
MLETAELGRRVDRRTYHAELDPLRRELLELQWRLRHADFPLVLIFEGVDNAAKGELVNTLSDWLDTRAVDFVAFGPKTDEERGRPRFWRYWRALPGRGRTAVFHSSWYTGTLIERTLNELPDADFDHHMRRIGRFETLLTREGALVLKFWLHMSAARQKAYFRELARRRDGRWLTSPLDRRLNRHHDRLCQAAERAIRLTDHARSPWAVIEAEDRRYRNLAVGRHIRDALAARLDTPPPAAPAPAAPETATAAADEDTVLDHLDPGHHHLDKATYKQRKRELTQQLAALTWRAHHEGISVVLVFEGWDAAGKGGTIRRLLRGIDVRLARVIEIAAPTDEELDHPYLWRFWRHLPRDGFVTLYDRSWYGRVLVERVENLTPRERWREAYPEINEFEDQLVEHGSLVMKFWLHIDADEQLRRFEARANTPHKHYKLTDEDWRNRERRPAYERAVHEMVAHTSTAAAPWQLIPANDKRYARVEVMQRLVDALHARLGGEGHK